MDTASDLYQHENKNNNEGQANAPLVAYSAAVAMSVVPAIATMMVPILVVTDTRRGMKIQVFAVVVGHIGISVPALVNGMSA